MVKRKYVLSWFRARGFVVQGGTNHDKLVHPDGRWTVLGRHGEIANQLFEKMKKDVSEK